jgi:putative endopeptidase
MNNKILALASASLLALSMPAFAQGGKPVYGDWGYNSASMDNSVKPGDDFWAYVNGGWDKKTPIPADRAGTGVGYVVSDQAEVDVRKIVEDLAKSGGAGVGQQVGDYFASWMDEPGIEAQGTKPLQPYLAGIAAIDNRSALLRTFGKPGYASPVGIGIIPDLADPTRYTTIASEGGLGMPGRDYYIKDDAKMREHRAAYRNYIIKIHELAGLGDAAAKADRIIALETALAKVYWEPEKQRDIALINNPMTVEQLTALAPQFEWKATLDSMGLGKVSPIIATQKDTFQNVGKMLDSVPLSTWKEWLAFRFVSDHGNLLPKAFDDARFAFFSKQLNGIETKRERWKRGVQLVNQALGEGVGKVYVERHYPPASNAQMRELITNLVGAYRERIQSNGWMDEATRKAALVKLEAFEPRIGHPVKWIDYTPLKVVRGDLLGNKLRADEFEWNLELERLPKPVDRALWGMNPQEVNAYYNPLANQITFPAAILQPPYFDPKADAAANYGAIGAVIGHEIGHGFDDQGRKFDAVGKVREWWTPETSKKYMARADKLGAQFSAYEPVKDLNINGKLTMGENIGDLGGLETAYLAYRRHVEKHGEPAVIGGVTGDQRFFIAYAQAWQTKYRDDVVRQQVLTDPHSPDKYRVNGIVRNVDAWYKAFNVKPGEKLYLPPEQRVSIW